MNSRYKALNVIDSVRPEMGGTAFFVKKMVSEMNRIDSESARIFSFGSPYCEDKADIDEYKIIVPRKSVFKFGGWDPAGYADLKKHVGSFDLVHQHGVWNIPAHYAVAAANSESKPLICSVHGMLEPWAMQRSQFKKKIAMHMYQRRDLKRVTAFHATSMQEVESIRRLGFIQPVAVIPPGIDFRENVFGKNQKTDNLKILFLSRVHPKKGIEILLEALGHCVQFNKNWELIVAGSGEESYVLHLKEKARKLGLEPLIKWVGFVEGAAKDALFRSADLFVLPTYSENFGIVIPEALSYGVPVITTHGTPWQDLEKQKCGWWIENSVESWTTTLRFVLGLPKLGLQEMGYKGREWVGKSFVWHQSAAMMIDTYCWILGNADQPKWVEIT